MFLAERLELDVDNRGNRLIAWIVALRKLVARYVPDHPPPVPLLERQRKPEWLWPERWLPYAASQKQRLWSRAVPARCGKPQAAEGDLET
jgi:hypothetical protein